MNKTTSEGVNGVAYLVTGEQLGISDEAPGKNLMCNFLSALTQLSTAPGAVLLVNTGVKLAVEGSVVLEDLQSLSDRGSDILSCGMCMDYYGVTFQIFLGHISDFFNGSRGIGKKRFKSKY